MHTKKTNNTNKLMQISYHSALTKIQKLQNLEKKKKKHFSVPVWNVDVSIPVYIPIRYIPADTAGTGTVLTSLLLPLNKSSLAWFWPFPLVNLVTTKPKSVSKPLKLKDQDPKKVAIRKILT